jgi:hypothetical protein
MKWIKERLHERSTWKGIVWLITACGVAITPEQSEAIITAGLAIAGVLDVFVKGN